MALSPTEIDLIEKLKRNLEATAIEDELLLRYYQGKQRVEHLGMAIPPAARQFLVLTDWGRVVVDTKAERQQVRSLVLPGEETADPQLRAIWDGSNLDAHVAMFNRDAKIYGRAFLSVGSNEADPSMPLVRVESPREMTAFVDVRREVVTAAARFYGGTAMDPSPTHVTLYQPNATVWVEKGSDGRWYEVDRDVHGLGVVPVLMHINRRMSSGWVGSSDISTAVRTIIDSGARSLTLMQFAQEAHGIPRIFMTGVSRGDFMDANGKPIPQFEAYFDAIHMLSKAEGKVGQLTAADLKNFETAMSVYRAQMVTATGYPSWYFGDTTIQPPTEGSVVGSESRLLMSVQQENVEAGKTLGWAMGLAMRFATGEWVEGNRVKVEWHNPATPTIAQRADAVVKMRQSGIVSREGAWDELGWSEARKAKERAYFEAEASDPALERITASLMGAADAGTDSGL